jgi:hypothetical protein
VKRRRIWFSARDPVRIRKRIVLETETHWLVTVRGHSTVARCPGCEQDVEMIAVACAEDPGDGASRNRIAKSGHFAVTNDGKLLVCRRWLCDHRAEVS